MRRRLWLPGAGLALLCAAACSLVVGSGNKDFPCTVEGQVGPPVCGDNEMCVNSRCVACRDVAGGCQADGGIGGTGGEVGEDVLEDKSSVGGAGGTDAGEERRDVGHGGTGGADVSEDEGSAGGPVDTGIEEATEEPEPVDVQPEQPPPTAKMGDPCGSGCDPAYKLICPVAGTMKDLCTRACCKSDDCEPGFVCLPAYGGAVCQKAPGIVGALTAGESCTTAESCRSGRCEAGACADTCCNHAGCKGNTRCALLGYSSILAWQCAAGGPSQDPVLNVCEYDSECKGNNCLYYSCQMSCCGACGGKCRYYQDGTAVVRSCGPSDKGPTPCCTNEDCSGGTGRCVPGDSGGGTYVLRCQ